MGTATAKQEKLNIDYTIKQAGKNRSAAGRRNRARLNARCLFLKSVFLCVLGALLAFPLVWIHAGITSLELKRSSLQKAIELENQLLQERKIEFARLSDPERIRTIAINKLNMRDATEVVYVIFEKEQIKSSAVALSHAESGAAAACTSSKSMR